MLRAYTVTVTTPEGDQVQSSHWSLELALERAYLQLEPEPLGAPLEYQAPDENCPSCRGRGWATVVVNGHGYAAGPCMCVGGHTWSAPVEPPA